MRIFGAGLADFPEEETRKIYGSLYGAWFVRIETFGANKAKVDAKKFIEWIRSSEREERERRRRMDAAQARLAYYIMTHYPEYYEASIDNHENVCETALKILTGQRPTDTLCPDDETHSSASTD